MPIIIYGLNTLGFPCPVCGYTLNAPAVDFEICPSCGVEFGYSDAGVSHASLRSEWISYGATWSSSVVHRPPGWNAWRQLIEAGFAYDIPWLARMQICETKTLVDVLEPLPFVPGFMPFIFGKHSYQ